MRAASRLIRGGTTSTGASGGSGNSGTSRGKRNDIGLSWVETSRGQTDLVVFEIVHCIHTAQKSVSQRVLVLLGRIKAENAADVHVVGWNEELG